MNLDRKTLRQHVHTLADQGAFREDDVTSATNLIAAIDECIPAMMSARAQLGEDVWRQVLALYEAQKTCRRERHNWTRFERLSEVPKGGFGAYALRRHCQDCDRVHTKWISWSGRPNGQNYHDEDASYRIVGASGEQAVYPHHLWLLEQYEYIMHHIGLAERRVRERPKSGERHLTAVA